MKPWRRFAFVFWRADILLEMLHQIKCTNTRLSHFDRMLDNSCDQPSEWFQKSAKSGSHSKWTRKKHIIYISCSWHTACRRYFGLEAEEIAAAGAKVKIFQDITNFGISSALGSWAFGISCSWSAGCEGGICSSQHFWRRGTIGLFWVIRFRKVTLIGCILKAEWQVASAADEALLFAEQVFSEAGRLSVLWILARSWCIPGLLEEVQLREGGHITSWCTKPWCPRQGWASEF